MTAGTVGSTMRRARALYTLLEQEIAKEFYDRDEAGIPRAWIARVRHSMTRLTAQFSSDRMVREYVEQAYLPAAEAYRRRSADGGRLARELTSQLVRIDDERARRAGFAARGATRQPHAEVTARCIPHRTLRYARAHVVRDEPRRSPSRSARIPSGGAFSRRPASFRT
jgi:hypothetical protein